MQHSGRRMYTCVSYTDLLYVRNEIIPMDFYGTRKSIHQTGDNINLYYVTLN